MKPRWFAVMYRHTHSGVPLGYALDYYPDERATYLREEGAAIIGDFATREEAQAAVRKNLKDTE
jgi:hypothetical protein